MEARFIVDLIEELTSRKDKAIANAKYNESVAERRAEGNFKSLYTLEEYLRENHKKVWDTWKKYKTERDGF